jgi:hypothetical protein
VVCADEGRRIGRSRVLSYEAVSRRVLEVDAPFQGGHAIDEAILLPKILTSACDFQPHDVTGIVGPRFTRGCLRLRGLWLLKTLG